jgi:hypothetical protein
MLRIVPLTVPPVGRSYEPFPDELKRFMESREFSRRVSEFDTGDSRPVLRHHGIQAADFLTKAVANALMSRPMAVLFGSNISELFQHSGECLARMPEISSHNPRTMESPPWNLRS